jgi:hypothetical protein
MKSAAIRLPAAIVSAHGDNKELPSGQPIANAIAALLRSGFLSASGRERRA